MGGVLSFDKLEHLPVLKPRIVWGVSPISLPALCPHEGGQPGSDHDLVAFMAALTSSPYGALAEKEFAKFKTLDAKRKGELELQGKYQLESQRHKPE